MHNTKRVRKVRTTAENIRPGDFLVKGLDSDLPSGVVESVLMWGSAVRDLNIRGVEKSVQVFDTEAVIVERVYE